MSSRQEILNNILKGKPMFSPLQAGYNFHAEHTDLKQVFMNVATGNGSKIMEITNLDDVYKYVEHNFDPGKRIVSGMKELQHKNNIELLSDENAHALQDVEVAVLEGSLGVAENSAIWITENQMKNRVLPFITQNLVVILNQDKIVALMGDAYEAIGNSDEGFSTFIAGPSKTADIEQSLVIGAHGSRSHHILLLKNR